MSSTFSVGGLASGLDTNSIVAQLMALERKPLTLLQNQQKKETSRLQAIDTLKGKINALSLSIGQLTNRATVNAKVATTDTPSTAPTVLTASAGAGAVNGSFTVTVSQLATATKTTSASLLGAAIDANVALASAGFRITPVTEKDGNPATYSINGTQLTVDNTKTLNQLVADIDALAGVSASLVADSEGRLNKVQIVSDPGQSLQIGSLGDTSNVLRLLNLADASVSGYTKAQTANSGPVDAGAINTSITVNGVTTNLNVNTGSSVGNATAIVAAINGNSANTVEAVDNGDGTFYLRQKTAGSQPSIDVTAAGTGTGLVIGLTKNGTDRVVSTANLGVADIGKSLDQSRTGIAAADGSFKINGVEITYKANESISTILNRINASSAGVTAAYDAIQDRVTLTATQTGARTMELADVTGNFLAATLGASMSAANQTIGQNAAFSISTVDGGAVLTSASNTVTDYVPGVTLNLKSVSATPVTVTIDQDTQATGAQVRSFVNAFNAVLDSIESLTKYDTATRVASALTGDSGIIAIERQLRSLIASPADGVGGKYRSLASIGISTGGFGAAVGSTNRLSLDDSKLTAALRDNPQAVEAVFAAFSATLGAPTANGVVTAVSGTPTDQHENGTYYVKVLDAAARKVEVRFVTADGRTLLKKEDVVTLNADNSTLVPGLKIKIGAALVDGAEDSFATTVTSRGVAIKFDDYLDRLLGTGGLFEARKQSSDAISQRLTKQIERLEERLAKKEEALYKRFTALEVAMARLNSQSGALASQIQQLQRQTSQ